MSNLSEAKRALLQKYLQGNLARPTPEAEIPRRTSDGPAPLSFAQEQMWLHSQMTPAPIYNDCLSLHIPGQLDAAALERSLNELIRRHEILRTSFPLVDGQPAQVVHLSSALSLPILDLRSLPAAEREAEALRLGREDAKHMFDLAQGPLLRARLAHLSDEDHCLFLTVHHLIGDGISWYQVLLPELGALYDAFAKGQPSPLADPPIQYADYSIWQRQHLQDETLAKHLAYWKQQLSGAPPVLELPTDHIRTPHRSHRGGVLVFSLPKSLAAALKDLSRQEGVTIFITLLAAFNTLLYRYTGQEDMVIGTVSAGRRHSQTRKMMGCFINPFVLRTNLSGNPSFRELLKRTREATSQALDHDELPFPYLVKKLHPERSSDQSPFYQIMMALDALLPALPSGWTISQLEATSEASKLDLGLEVDDRPEEGLIGRFEYSADLFEAATIERLYKHWLTILEAIVADPAQPLATIPMLTPAERQQILVDWNATQAPYPADQCFHQLIEAQVERTPDAVAIVCADQRLTYRELNTRANQLAHFLRQKGVGPEVLVGLCLNRSVDLLVGLLGILKAGGAYIPLDPAYPSDRLAFIMSDSEAHLLVTQKALLPTLPTFDAEAICLDRDWPTIAQQPQTNPSSGVQIENLAYMIYTSGSTGKPKGVLVTHRGIPNLATGLQQTFQSGPTSRILQVASISFDASVWDILMALTVGGTLYVATDIERIPGPALLRLLQEQKITLITLTPSALAALPEGDLPDLKIVISAAEACSTELVARWSPGRRFFNGYGPTEATVAATLAECTDSRSAPPIGRPLLNMQAYVLDANRQPVPVGVPGELCLGGVTLARGYHKRLELTEEKFIPHPFSSEPGARLYRTGDLVYWRADGNLEFAGRIDDQVKIRGFRIELGEIETTLLQHPSVSEALVIAREDTPGNKRLVAYLIPRPGQSITYKEMRTFLKDHLPEYMLPSAFVVLDELPVTANGKINRKALPIPEGGAQVEEDNYVAPALMEHFQLLGIWEELLDARPIGIRDNFFFLGGYSLLAAKMIARIEDTFGKKIPLATLFSAPTIEDITKALQQQANEHPTPAPIYAIQTGGARRPLFFMHGALDGGGFYCYRLARALGPEQPFYALQPYQIEGLRVPPTFEEMAAAHIEAIRSIQPEGPYQVGGVCNGGLVAAEMARQLQAQGQEVELAVLIDPTLPASRFGDLGRKASYLFGKMLGFDADKKLTLYLTIRHINGYLRELVLQTVSPGFRRWIQQYRGKPNKLWMVLPKFIPPSDELRKNWQDMFVCIMPGRLPDFQAKQTTFFWTAQAEQERMGWRTRTEGNGIANYPMPGDHFDWTDESVAAFAGHLSAHLEAPTPQVREEALVAAHTD